MKHGGISAAAFPCLLLAEGLAIGALIHGGIDLMRTDQDFIQGAVVLAVAVIGALLHGAFDTLVGVAVHAGFLLYLNSELV